MLDPKSIRRASQAASTVNTSYNIKDSHADMEIELKWNRKRSRHATRHNEPTHETRYTLLITPATKLHTRHANKQHLTHVKNYS